MARTLGETATTGEQIDRVHGLWRSWLSTANTRPAR